ncbi:MAG TPA: hypothetical protein PKD55_11825 [Bellilinea sp.]|nr:hypothetical protein [Bellilinea sp.]
MKLNAPTQIVWIIALVLGLLGLLGQIGILAFAAPYAFWLVFVGLVLVLLATLFAKV